MLDLGLHRVQLFSIAFELLLGALDLCQQGLNVLTRCFGLADALGAGVALLLQALGLGLQRLALGFQRVEGGDIQGVAAASQRLGHAFNVRAQQFGVDHDRA